MNHMFLLIVGLAVGVFVGYKYPGQVEQGVETTKKLYNDVKDKFFKGSSPKGPSGQ
jgi:hypothetical protein